MKIKCPLCNLEFFDKFACESHLVAGHFPECIARKLLDLEGKIHEKIEALEQQNEDNAFCESGENLSGQVGLLKSLLENEK